MPIDTVDAFVAGLRQPVRLAKSVTPTLVAGRPHSLWALAGTPGAGAYDGTLNGVVLSSSSALVNGQIPHFDPASGVSKLAYLLAQATQGGTLEVRDRLWHNGGYTITSTAAQNSTTPTWPSRCPTSGLDDTPTTTGRGVMLACEISGATGAGTPTITANYTDSDGNAGANATNIQATVASSAAGAVYDIGWAPGDVGVRSLQSITLSATWTSGTMNMVAYRLLAAIPLQAGLPSVADALTGLGTRLYNGCVPWLVFVPNTTTASVITGMYTESQG